MVDVCSCMNNCYVHAPLVKLGCHDKAMKTKLYNCPVLLVVLQLQNHAQIAMPLFHRIACIYLISLEKNFGNIRPWILCSILPVSIMINFKQDLHVSKCIL